MPNKQKSALEQELASIVNEVSEVLKKSGVLTKDDDQIGDVPPEHTEPDADNAGGPSDQDADNVQGEGEAAQPPVEGAPAEGADQPAPAPGAEGGQGDESTEMASHAAELSDEELESMLQVLMAEVEKRHAGQAGAEGAAPEGQPQGAAPAPQAAPAPEPMAASMKSELAGLAKSVAEIAEAVKGLTGDVGTLKKSVSEKRNTVIVGKPAQTNQNVQVLQKSVEQKERLNKSDTLNYLLSEQRNGNKRVNSDMIAGVNACRSEEDLASAQNDIAKLGIKLP